MNNKFNSIIAVRTVRLTITLVTVILCYFAVGPVLAQLAEERLDCRTSYTATLYDTPSGHLELGYYVGEASASTTEMILTHELGEQSWTKCYDRQGNEYEFKLTQEEYAALQIAGKPIRSKPAN